MHEARGSQSHINNMLSMKYPLFYVTNKPSVEFYISLLFAMSTKGPGSDLAAHQRFPDLHIQTL